MGSESWKPIPFTEAVEVNPAVKIKRGDITAFVDMKAISPGTRDVEESERREFRGGGSKFMPSDTLMARITPCLENGKIARYRSAEPEPAHGSTEFIVVRGRSGVTDNDFAYYLTRSEDIRLRCIGLMTGTSGRQRVPTDSLQSLDVALPPLDTQRTIAHILGTLDDKIELNRRTNQTLESIARALFKSWFIDFDPIHAKAAGDPVANLDPATAALFPDTFEDSELGQIPTGWTAQPVSEILDVNPRRTIKKGHVVPYLDMKGMPTDGHCVDTAIDRAFKSGSKFINGDTLLARITPCLENGKTAFVDFLKDDQVAWGSTEYIVLRPKAPLPVEYAYYLARSETLRSHAIASMSGTSGRQRVPNDSFDQLLVAVPPYGLGKAFGDIARVWMAKIRANTDQSRTLATLRDTLLPKLLSGEIDVAQLKQKVHHAV